MAHSIDISEVSRRSGLPASTIRFYEQKGLIRSIGRRGLRRLFSTDIEERLALIKLGQAAGFSLDEISVMFSTKPLAIDRTQLLTKADTLDKKIRQLTAIRDGLRHAAVCPAPSHLACPTFQRLLKLVSKNRPRRLIEPSM